MAPIFNEEGKASYYLPNGLWSNYLTGEQANGGCWREEHHDYMSIPLWVRENSIIATGKFAKNAEYDFRDNLKMKVYGLTSEAHTEVYQNEKLVTSVVLTRECNKIHGEVKGDTKLEFCFVGEHIKDVTGAKVCIDGKNSILSTSENNCVFTCILEG